VVVKDIPAGSKRSHPVKGARSGEEQVERLWRTGFTGQNADPIRELRWEDYNH